MGTLTTSILVSVSLIKKSAPHERHSTSVLNREEPIRDSVDQTAPCYGSDCRLSLHFVNMESDDIWRHLATFEFSGHDSLCMSDGYFDISQAKNFGKIFYSLLPSDVRKVFRREADEKFVLFNRHFPITHISSHASLASSRL